MRAFIRKAEKQYFKIGIVGYSAAYFDRKEAKKILENLIKQAKKDCPRNHQISIVSGLTKMGIPLIAYQIAKEKGYHTVGYACSQAEDMPIFPVDEKNIIGEDWGDESEEFLNNIDCLIRVGGGKQSKEETKKAKSLGLPIFEEESPQMVSYCLMGAIDKESSKDIYEKVSNKKAVEIKEPDSYHVTLRYWLKEPTSKSHENKVLKYLKERFQYPVFIEVDFQGETDVFGDEEACVLKVESSALFELQKEIDEELQKLEAPPSDYSDYCPHVTVAEGLKGNLSLKPCRLLINRWFFTKGTQVTEDNELLWELEYPQKKVIANKIVTSEKDFVEILKKARTLDEALDFLIYNTKEETVTSAVCDHFLLMFFAGLNGFTDRKDFEEEEVEQFKECFPYEEYNIDRERLLQKIKNYRSVNRIIDEIVEEISIETKNEIAREHIKKFYFEQCCKEDLEKFVTAIRPGYWIRNR